MGSLAFPFIDQGRGLGYTREKRNEEKEEREKQGRRRLRGCVSILLLLGGSRWSCR
jgi:hypothetical protein